MTSAPFRYWGSKVRMAPGIVERLPPHDHFVEVCCGSAAVLMNKPHQFYDDGPWRVLGDFRGHANVANGSGRRVAVERLYILDKSR